MSTPTMPKEEKSVKSEAITVVPLPEERAYEPAKGYEGAGQTQLTDDQAKALMTPFADEEHDIKPTKVGEVYVGHQHVRRRLNVVIGPGAWTLVPVADSQGHIYFTEKEGKQVNYRGRLYIYGNFISEAIGEQGITHSAMSYSSACEAARSDALVRCCKDLSIGWECWDKQWTEKWKQRFALRVAVRQDKETAWLWRRKDAAPLRGEFKMGTEKAPDEKAGPTINKQQQADLWSLATELFERKDAEAMLREVVGKFGFDSTASITEAKYQAILAALKKAGK